MNTKRKEKTPNVPAEIEALNIQLEEGNDYVINLCPLPFICDGETCEGGWCHGVCWGD